MINNKSFLIIFLFLLFYVSACTDMVLSRTALDDGFYETNNFTNNTSLSFHLIVLVSSVFGIILFSRRYINDGFTILFLVLLNLVWFVNNVWSVVLLSTL